MSPIPLPGDARQWWSDIQGRVSDVARKWTDPREKQLRKVRRARRRTTRYGGMSLVSGAGMGALALASAPEWTVVVGGGMTALFAIPAVAAWGKFRKYRSEPLPPPQPARRFQPHHASAVHAPMTRLGAAEHSLYRLVLVLDRSQALPPGEAEGISRAAMTAGDSLEGAAKDVVGMELARAKMRQARSHTGTSTELTEPIRVLTDYVTAGVEEIEDLASVAAQMTDAALGVPRPTAYTVIDQQREQLRDVTDRVAGLTIALHELRRLPHGGTATNHGSAQSVAWPRIADGGGPRTSPDLRASGLT